MSSATVNILRRLIAFDTTSRNSNLELMAYIEAYMRDQGVTHISTYHSPDRKKANMFVTLPGANGTVDGGLVLSGHTDVVPVDGQDWATKPFEMCEKKGTLFGRGTCDMKGFIAVCLAMVPTFLALPKRQKPIHMAFSYDEEVGCVGCRAMLEAISKQLKAGPRKPFDGCIIGEPTSMDVVVAHKGQNGFVCSVTGKNAHSSLTAAGCNAIEHAAKVICKIREIAEEHRQHGPFEEYYDLPYTSFATTMVKGGTAVNIIPESCDFFFEFRNLPHLSAKELAARIEEYVQREVVPKMQQEYPGARIKITQQTDVPGLSREENCKLVALAKKIGGKDAIRKVAYATEGGLFRNACDAMPTIVCGPGSIEQAHRANEFVTKAQLAECENFLLCMVRAVEEGGLSKL